MAYADLIAVVGGDPGLASEAQQNKDNWDYIIDSSASNKIHTDLVVAASITAGAVGTSEIATDGVGQDEIAASAVGQGELKTATAEVSAASSSTGLIGAFTGDFLFGKEYKWSSATLGGNACTVDGVYGVNVSIPTTYGGGAVIVDEDARTSGTAYAQALYVQASPPYRFLDEDDWGHWLCVERDNDGRLMRAWRASDPPWAHRAVRLGIPKDHPGGFYILPHPMIGATGTVSYVDLRDYRQRVKRNRCARECAALQARRGEFLARGLPVQLIDQLEAQAAAKAQAEAQENAALENELADKDAATERVIHELGKGLTRRVRRLVHPSNVKDYPAAHVLGEVEIKRAAKSEGPRRQRVLIEHDENFALRSEAQMVDVRTSLRRKAEKRKAWLNHQLFQRTRMDEIEEDLAAQGKSILQALHESEGHGPEEDKSRPVVEECCGVNWKAIRESDTTLPGGADVPGLKEAGVRVVGR